MKQEDIDMVEKILDTEYVGYAYVYPEPDQPRKEYMLAITPENLSNFIGAQGAAAKQIMITDMLDRPIVDTRLGMVNDCPDQKLCQALVSHLAPIQMGVLAAHRVRQCTLLREVVSNRSKRKRRTSFDFHVRNYGDRPDRKLPWPAAALVP